MGRRRAGSWLGDCGCLLQGSRCNNIPRALFAAIAFCVSLVVLRHESSHVSCSL